MRQLPSHSSLPPTRARLRGWFPLLATLALAGCSSGLFEERDSAPDKKLNWSQIPDASPRWEPKARYGNHSPYQVRGKTYHVMASAQGYQETGIASWYGKKFSGRPTSSMEPYDPYAMTAAHKTLPIPSYVKVTRLDNNRSIIVRVNDRGPFHDDRIIDLSYAAAHKLGYANDGVARVRVEAIHSVPTIKAGQPGIYLQAGAFKDESSAKQLQQKLAAVTESPVSIFTGHGPNDGLHRVQIGPFSDHSAAIATQTAIRNSRIADPMVVKR